MGAIKKLFPKKKKEDSKSQLTSQAKLKTLTNKLNMQIKDYDRKSQLCRIKAKQFLKAGNRVAAKNMLAREKRFQQKISQYSAMIMKAERRLDALNQIDTLKEVGDAMEGSASELKIGTSELNLQHQMEVDADAEAAMDELEEASELFAGDPELDYAMEGMDEELAQLETELALDEMDGLPDTPIDVDESSIVGVSMSLDDDDMEETPVKNKEKLQEEISALKKELDF